MNLTHKSVKLELKLDAERRRISGYASIFGNVDSTGDIVMQGAFAKSLGARKIRMLYQHSDSKLMGLWDIAREDDKGLYVEGQLAKTPLGDEVYELASMGALDSMSIGYNVSESEYNKDGVRLLKEVDLWEVSLVTFPANNLATITGVKSAPDNEREFENFLREVGKFSQQAAKIITAKGFKALSGQRDVEADGLVSSLQNNINILKG